jgi:hypothetical protein
MPYFAIAAVVASVASAAVNKRASRAQNRNQQAWNLYNARQQYGTDQFNIAARGMIAQSNAALAMSAAELRAKVGESMARTNADIVWNTALYNDTLLEDELEVMWDSLELDQELLANERAVERGAMLAAQSASGTVMGQDSNAEVITDQMVQENLDAFILRHGADIKAAQIANARAQGLWEANMEAKRILWEGKLGGMASRIGGAMDAAAGLVSANISNIADSVSAKSRYNAGVFGAQTTYANNNAQIGANFTSSMASAATQAVGAYYNAKTPNVPDSLPAATQSSTSWRGIPYRGAPAYQPSISQSGSSLLG